MRLNKDDIYSLIGTVAFHGVILLILWFTVLKTEVPDEDGGVLVNFGNVDAAAGMFEPKYTGQEPPQETTTPPPPVPEPQVETPKQELITQDIEESVALEDAKKKNEEEKRKKQEAEKKQKEEEEKDRIFRQAHDCCFSNKEQIEKSEKCGCFFCGEIFSPSEITDYLPDEPPTAECPFCYTDSVIGDASGFPITKDFLKKMKKRYF